MIARPSTSITIEGVRKSYGSEVAIKALSLEVRGGEFFTLLGPSGCGKTTLLRMIAGFNSIDQGVIRFGDQVINSLPPGKRNIGIVFQNYALFPHMSVARNVSFGLERRGLTKLAIEERVAEALEKVRMADLADRLPGALSGGQQQRVALARALVISPTVLLMDEPLSNLDAKLRIEMRDLIREIQQEARITTIYVTHDQEEAMAVSDRIAVMNAGAVEQVATPRGVYHHPESMFVAEFVGKTNFLRRPVRVQDGRAVIELSGTASLDLGSAPVLGDCTEVIASIRPEALHESSEGFEAVVVSQVFLGPHSHVRVRLDAGELMDFFAVSQDEPLLNVGDIVHMSVGPAGACVYDARTGRAVARVGE